MKIISNNPLVQIRYPQLTEFVDTGIRDVFFITRDFVHLGARLVNHPLSGTLSSGEAPYASLVIEEADAHTPIRTDFFSLTLIENAIKQLKEPPAYFEGYDEKILEDFKIIDLDMLENCIKQFK